MRPRAGNARTSRLAVLARPLIVALVATSLVAGIVGGLLRVGVQIGVNGAASPVVINAALAHAALMIVGFLGSVIAIERAVAVKRRIAFLAPLASGAAGVALLAGHATAGAWLGVAASLVFTGVNVVLVQRQRAPHTLLLLASALAWLIGNLLFATGFDAAATLPWWFAFLVVTIAAERLEMTRLLRHRPATQAALLAALALLGVGAACSALEPTRGGVLYGVALTLLALWFARFDIARRTVLAHGLSRYMALCLLSGYAWLAVAGIAWAATALGFAGRDIALHALGLGFIVSMVMGHAPVILPAVARVKLQFGAFFYAPLAALHLSLVARLAFGHFDAGWKSAGALLNAAAIALFALTVVGSALAWRATSSAARASRA